MHTVKQEFKIVRQEIRQRQRTARPKNIHMASIDHRIGRPVELIFGNFVQGPTNHVDILIHHGIEQFAFRNVTRSNFQTLHGGEPAADHFLHGLLQARVPVIPDFGGKAHHRRFAHAHGGPQFRRRHERYFVVVFLDIPGDQFLSFGKAMHMVMNALDQLVIHSFSLTLSLLKIAVSLPVASL